MRLKAYWSVVAGILPGEPMKEHSRSWNFLSTDYEAADATERFEKMRAEAEEYARSLTDPSRVNWVRLEFMWM